MTPPPPPPIPQHHTLTEENPASESHYISPKLLRWVPLEKEVIMHRSYVIGTIKGLGNNGDLYVLYIMFLQSHAIMWKSFWQIAMPLLTPTSWGLAQRWLMLYHDFWKYIWIATWQNQKNDLCAQRRLWSAWASTQFDQSYHCPPEEALGPKLPIEHTAKAVIRLYVWQWWSESLLGAQVILMVLSCGG